MTKIFILITSLLLTQLVQGQDIAQVTCMEIDILKHFHRTIHINGQELKIESTVQLIKIDEHQFDTLIFEKHDGDIVISLTKMRNGGSYILKGNPCSGQGYELLPEKDGRMGMLRYDRIEKDSLFGYLDNDYSFLNAYNMTSYLEPQKTGMCFFNPKSIGIKSLSYKDDMHSTRLIFEAEILFNFLHGELLLANVNHSEHQIKLTIEGYIKEGESLDMHKK